MAPIHKTFILALSFLANSPQKTRDFLKDKRLTNGEKIILEAYLLLRQSKFDEILQRLHKVKFNDPFLESQRFTLIGITMNNQGLSNEAIPYLVTAVELGENSPNKERLFECYHNLFIAYYNLGDISCCEYALDEMIKYRKKILRHEIEIKNSHALIFNSKMMFDEAFNVLVELKKAKNDMTGIQLLNYHFLFFDLCIKTNHIEEAYNCLEGIKKLKSFRVKADYQFLNQLLNFHVHGTSLYLYHRDLEGNQYLLAQAEILMALESKDLFKAKSIWTEMVGRYPKIYAADFNYLGSPCLFSVCLTKLLNLQKQTGRTFHFENENKQEMLYKILIEQTSLTKEEIYLKLYKKPVENKDDLKKLAWQVSQLRKSKKIDIKSRKGCYILFP